MVRKFLMAVLFAVLFPFYLCSFGIASLFLPRYAEDMETPGEMVGLLFEELAA